MRNFSLLLAVLLALMGCSAHASQNVQVNALKIGDASMCVGASTLTLSDKLVTLTCKSRIIRGTHRIYEVQAQSKSVLTDADMLAILQATVAPDVSPSSLEHGRSVHFFLSTELYKKLRAIDPRCAWRSAIIQTARLNPYTIQIVYSNLQSC
jgi:hypothetical protein